MDISDSQFTEKTLHYLIHVDCPEKVQNLQNKINISFPELKPFLLSEFTPGLSLHTGPGTIGITILTRE